MSLLDVARADAARHLSDTSGFSTTVELEAPGGATASVRVMLADTSVVFDPATGMMVTGRTVRATVSDAELASAGIGTPVGPTRSTERPWILRVDGAAWAIRDTEPDRTLRVTVWHLESWGGS